MSSADKINMNSIDFIISADIGDEHSSAVEIIWQARSRDDRSPVPLPEDTRDWLYGFVD